jgi:hypothetical protein
MGQIARGSSALNFLNGQEDPKLKRLLEIQLLTSIDAARDAVAAGVDVSLASVAIAGPNWLDAISRARTYIGSHKIARIPGATERVMNPLESLTVIERWLQQRQKALPAR